MFYIQNQQFLGLKLVLRITLNHYFVVVSWGKGLIDLLPSVLQYVKSEDIAAQQNAESWNYFGEKWTWYLKLRGNLL